MLRDGGRLDFRFSKFFEMDGWDEKLDGVDEMLRIDYLTLNKRTDGYISRGNVEILSRDGQVSVNCANRDSASAIFSKASMLEKSLKEELWSKMAEDKKLFDAGIDAYETSRG